MDPVTEPDGRPGQWYLHLFDAAQPDLNWDNPEIAADLERTLRFWLDRGVAGFRIDVAHGMAKPADLPDMADPEGVMLATRVDDPRFNNDGVHAIHRGIRTVLDDYPEAATVGEVWVFDNEDFAKYLRPEELHLGFNFRLVRADFTAPAVREAIENSLAAAVLADSPPTWTLSNHDVEREVSRYGGGAQGLSRARAMALVMLALPGAVFVYNGEELGLPNVELPDNVLQDPVWERSGHTERGRDGCRVPLPWSGDAAPYGFSSTTQTWLPMPDDWGPLTVAAQSADPESTLSLFRRAIELRRGRTVLGRSVRWLPTAPGLLAFQCEDGLVCLLNAGSTTVDVPAGRVVLASGPLSDGRMSPDTTLWLTYD